MRRAGVCAWLFSAALLAQDEAFLSLMREYNEAGLLAGQLHADEAVPRLKAIIEKDWRFHRAYLTLAEVSVHTGRVSEAEEYFRELIAKNPKNGYAWYGLAQLRIFQSQRPYTDELVRCVNASPEALVCYAPEVLPHADPAYPGYWYAKSRQEGLMRENPAKSAAKAIELAKARHEDDYLPMLTFYLGAAINTSWDRHEEALRLARSAAEMASRRLDKEMAGLAQAAIAGHMYPLGQSREARQILDGLLHEAEGAGDRRLAAARASSLATLCMETGDYECARRAWKVQLAFQQSVRSVPPQVHALYRLGETEIQAGDPKAAIAWIEAALRFDFMPQKPFLYRTLAAAYLMQGDSFLTLRLLMESRDLFRSQGKDWQAGADTGSLGNLYASLGADVLAESCYRESAASARRFRDPGDEQRVLIGLARLLVRQNRLKEASTVAAGALERANRVRYPAYQPATYLVLADVAMREGRQSEARRWLEHSLAAARELSRYADEVQALIQLGKWEAAAGRLSEAGGLGGQAVQAAKMHGLVWPLADAHQAMGLLEMQQGHPETAWRHFQEAMEVIESLRGKLPANDLHLGFSRKMWPLYEEAVNALAAMGASEAALEAGERGRARAFLEQLPAARGRDGVRVLDGERLLAFAREWSGVVVTYVLSEPQSTAWLLDGRQIRMVRLAGRGAIERMVRRHRLSLSRLPAGAETDYCRMSRELYTALVAPFEEGLKPGQKLAVVPDGILHYLPFETLASGSGRFLVEDHPIMYAPSVSVLASLSRTGADGASRRELLAYGDPRFTAGQARGRPVQALYRSAGYRFVRLPATRQEVLGIGSYFPAPMRTLLLGEAATEQSVKEADLRAYRRLHFATHAVLDERVPARSGIVLSQIGTGREDGILHASEVMELKLDAELVVLSACRTGLGQLVGGEGMVGLTRSFFHAGAQRVVVSLWDVNDQSTARLMKEFYRQMTTGHGPADALRAAKLSFLRSNAPLERHPHFWAGFVLSGAE